MKVVNYVHLIQLFALKDIPSYNLNFFAFKKCNNFIIDDTFAQCHSN